MLVVYHWDFQDPFVTFEGGVDGLSDKDRDRLEQGITDEQRRKGVADLRLLDAYRRCA